MKRIPQLIAAALLGAASLAQAQNIVMASTTSTEQSGLFAHLLPAFTAATGVTVKVVAVGTGQAIDMGRRGDAKLRGKDIAAALSKVAQSNAPFISRGDKSGTNAAELRYWKLTAADSAKGSGYRECGCGMGPALNMAASTGAYVLADRATWLSFKNRADLAVLVEGDTRLFNQYGVLVVNPAKHPHTKVAEAQKFADWVTSSAGQAVIAAYKIEGQQLFFPNAGK